MAIIFPQVLEKLPIDLISLFSFIVLTIILYQWLLQHNTSLPSPRKLPVIGNLHQLSKLPHRTLRTLSNKYGDLMLLHLGNKPTLVVSSTAYAEEILKTQDIVFASRPNSKTACIVFYNNRGLGFAKYGEHWRKVRSISVMHMLCNKQVQSFRKIREEEVFEMVERLRKSSSTPVSLIDTFTRAISDVTSRFVFGKKYDGKEGREDVKKLLNGLSAVLGKYCIGDLIPWLGWIDSVSGVLHEARKIARGFDEFIEKIVQEQESHESRNDKVNDLVDVLLQVRRNDPSLDRESIKSLLLDMLAGGTHTISTLLEWAMTELLINPRVMKKLQDEVRGFKESGKTMLDEDDIKTMTYLKAVINESLRLHLPAPLLLFHESTQDTKIGNHFISKGTQVITNGWAIHRDPRYWDKPEEFRPERFLETSATLKGQKFEFIPFGARRRGCPAILFANTMAELALANVVSEFNWELNADVDCESFMAEAVGKAAHRQNPLMAIPTVYSPNN